MPTNTNNKTNSTEKKTTTTKTESSEAKRIAELEEMIKQLTKTMAQMQGAPINNGDYEEDKDINPNKKTRITSLTYGYFSLYAPNRGFLKFPNYGSYHTVSYAQLVDYVNACRTAAENGNFYIHNQDMVEDLGLSEIYDLIAHLWQNPQDPIYFSFLIVIVVVLSLPCFLHSFRFTLLIISAPKS